MVGNRSFFSRPSSWLLVVLLAGASPLEGFAQEKSEPKPIEKVYVNVARSNLRNGPGAEWATQGVVAAGQELEVLGAQDEWLRVEAPGGKPGWIIRKATTSTPPTPVVVKTLERKIGNLQDENEDLAREIRRLSDARQDLELQASQLKAEVALLTSKTEELKSWRTVMWVMLGLVVLFTGWALGFLTGMFRRQAEDKRYDTLMKDAASKKA